MKANKMDRPNSGIKCEVDSCHYYLTGDKCSAEMIEVQPQGTAATSTSETGCATFIPEA